MSEETNALRVHLVDDDSAHLLYLFHHLAAAGLRVAASSNPLDALETIARSKPEVAVCGTDLPDFSGFELLARIREISPRTQVVLMSLSGGWLEREEARRMGALDFILKPCRANTVLRAVERVTEAAK